MPWRHARHPSPTSTRGYPNGLRLPRIPIRGSAGEPRDGSTLLRAQSIGGGKERFIQALNAAGASVPAGLRFRTQAAEGDGTIPDLIGEDAAGGQVLLIEAKFWAGLTDQQPVGYLRRLQRGGGGTLTFIAPATRLGLLWAELVRRCEEAGIEIKIGATGVDACRTAAVSPDGRLLLVSWRGILDAVRSALDVAGESILAADVLQLQGLCERMDEEAFLPLRSEELTQSTGRRTLQFNSLVDAAYGLLSTESHIDGSRLRTSAGNGWYGRYFRIHGIPCLLLVSMNLWSRNAATPIWLQLWAADFKSRSALVEEKLRSAGFRDRRDFFSNESSTSVPIYLPTGVEREQVLDAILRELGRIGTALAGTEMDQSADSVAAQEELDGEVEVEPGMP